MARGKQLTAKQRIDVGRRMMFGIPIGMSVKGAQKMEMLIEYLYEFRTATLEQLTRCLPGEAERQVSRWLAQYPFIRKQMEAFRRYDVNRHKWVFAHKRAVYTLTTETLLQYEEIKKYVGEGGYTDGNVLKVDHKPRNLENMLHVIELFTRTFEASQGLSIAWVSNQYTAYQLKKGNELEKKERLQTSGFIDVERNGDKIVWGIGVYVNQTSGAMNVTKSMFPPKLHRLVEAIMLVRNEHLGRIHEIALKQERSKGVNDDLYFRFVPYEFSLEHPKWFLSLLHGNRWGALDALIENVKYRGGVVEEPKYHPFHYRVTHADGQIEYIDTSYGAQLMKMIDLLTHKATERATYTLYVSDNSEMEPYKAIVRKEKMMMDDEEMLWLTFRLIDWPGGTK